MRYALIAGGSKGIGYAISVALARRNYNLVLIGRHLDSLESARNNLESLYKIKVEILQQDLSLPGVAEIISKWCELNEIPVTMLCNVAGLGGNDDYLSLPVEDLRYMISINISSQMALNLSLLPNLEKNAPSFILNVSSMAGFAPIPEKNLYSATKAAVIAFSYSLRYQLQKKNISVSCLCPGPVFTKPEVIRDTMEKLGFFGKLMAVEPAKVGEVAVKLTLKRRLIIIPGLLPGVISVLLRIFPYRFTAFVYHKLGDSK